MLDDGQTVLGEMLSDGKLSRQAAYTLLGKKVSESIATGTPPSNSISTVCGSFGASCGVAVQAMPEFIEPVGLLRAAMHGRIADCREVGQFGRRGVGRRALVDLIENDDCVRADECGRCQVAIDDEPVRTRRIGRDDGDEVDVGRKDFDTSPPVRPRQLVATRADCRDQPFGQPEGI